MVILRLYYIHCGFEHGTPLLIHCIVVWQSVLVDYFTIANVTAVAEQRRADEAQFQNGRDVR